MHIHIQLLQSKSTYSCKCIHIYSTKKERHTVSRSQTFVQENWLKPDGGQFVKSQKNCGFVMLSVRINLSNANRPYGPKSSHRIVL